MEAINEAAPEKTADETVPEKDPRKAAIEESEGETVMQAPIVEGAEIQTSKEVTAVDLTAAVNTDTVEATTVEIDIEKAAEKRARLCSLNSVVLSSQQALALLSQ